MSRLDGKTSEACASFLYEETLSSAEQNALRGRLRAGNRLALAAQINRVRAAPSFRVPVMASPPTYSLSAATAATTIANSRNFDAVVDGAVSPYFTYWGGAPVVAAETWPNNMFVRAKSSTVLYTTQQPEIEFLHHGRYLDLRTQGQGGANVVIVDGEAFSQYATTQSPALIVPSDGNFYRVVLDFGSVANRRIGFRTANIFQGVTCGPNDTIFPTSKTGVPRCVWMGDSFSEGVGALDLWSGFVSLVGASLGWDTYASGAGGTGYLATAGEGRGTFRSRITPDVFDYSPEIVVIAGGINDSSSQTTSATLAEAELLYDAILAGLPNAQLIVVSPFWPTGELPVWHTTISPLLKTACESRGGIYVDLLSPKLVTGTGHAGTPQTDGNATIITSSDSTHPTQAGHEIYAAAIYHQIIAKLAL